MSWASELPKELKVKPLPLVVLTGLDIKHNTVHKEVWDNFSSRSNQKFRYKLLDGDHEYPKVKNKRSTANYDPKGIFKTNWFNKHLNQVPSLVVIFFDLDWDEPNWKEKQMECATKVELVRHSLLERNTRISLVLIQKNPNMSIDADNVVVRERYPALCNACSIKNNYLFLLQADHLHGYITKLEDEAFNEPTQTYYSLEIKAIKFKRDSLIKVQHQFLFVRLAMKIGFFHEMRSDNFKAIEYYKMAYLSLLDIRYYDTNILEIKTIASIINFKLCHLYFEIKHPIDAIDQFRKHIDIFRIKVGPPELTFEHSAWLAKQFQIMGELFEEAIQKGSLVAVQWQHPGFYFHSAANHTIQRRVNCKDLSLSNIPSRNWTPENPSPIESLNNLEFYGQRPWRQGHVGMDILDVNKERDGILSLQEFELKINLTPLISDLFKQAITHFVLFKCERMKQYLMVCMAEEYLFAKEYQESLNIYVKVLNDYSSEHWWPILTSIMSNAIKCAFHVADITNYCLIITELISKNTLITDKDKSLLQQNLMRVLNNELPLAEYHQIENSPQLTAKWKSELSKSSLVKDESDKSQSAHKIIAAHVSSMVPFVECKACFSAPMFNSNQYCELFLFIRTNCVEPVKFNKLNVRFNLSSYNQYCLVDNDDNNESLSFKPNEVKDFRFKFLTNKQDHGKDLEVSSISLELGKKDTRVLVLHWKGDCKNSLAIENNTLNTFYNLNSVYPSSAPSNKVYVTDSSNKTLRINWDSILSISSTKIVSRKANIILKLDHRMPIFVDEYYLIKLTIDNQEDTIIQDINLTVELQAITLDAPLPNAEKPYRLWIGDIDKSNQTSQSKSLGNLESKNQKLESIYIQTKDIANLNLIVKINYQNDYVYKHFSNLGEEKNDLILEKDISIKCSCVQEDLLRLDSINAFKYDFKFYSIQMKPIKYVRIGEPFIVVCDVKNETPYPLKFKNSFLKTDSNVSMKSSLKFDNQPIESLLKGETLKHREMATECFCLVVNEFPKQSSSHDQSSTKRLCSLGDYYVEWKRKSIQHTGGENGLDLNVDDDDDEEDDEVDFNSHLDFNDPHYVKTKIKLPEVFVESFPFFIETKLPTYGVLEESLTITCKIKNKTQSQILDLECNLDENEYFSVGGNKVEIMQVMPNDSTDYTYVIYPLQTGYCRLPQLHIKLNNVKSNGDPSTNDLSANNDWNNLDSVIQNMIPNQIFIMPEKL